MARTSSSEQLAVRLGLSEDELLGIFDADPLSVIAGELDARPEVAILAALTAEFDEALLRRWLRLRGAGGRSPLELLLAHDFAAFEDAAGDLRERGIVLRGGGIRPTAP